MFSFKFSIVQAYKTGLQQLYKNIFQYILWFLIIGIISVISMMAMGIYIEILNFAAIKQHFLSFVYSITERPEFDTKGFGMAIAEREVSSHTILSYFLPVEFLNQSLMSLTMTEYYNLIFKPKWFVLLLSGFASFWCLSLVYVGFIKSAFKSQNNGKISLVDMVAHYRYVMPYLGAGFLVFFIMCGLPFLISLVLGMLLFLVFQSSIVTGLIIILGFIYLIYMLVRLYFVLYFLFDKNSGILQSIKQSWNLTRTSKFEMFIFMLIGFLFSSIIQQIFGLVGLKFLGIMFSIVIMIHATIYVFKALLAKQEQSA